MNHVMGERMPYWNFKRNLTPSTYLTCSKGKQTPHYKQRINICGPALSLMHSFIIYSKLLKMHVLLPYHSATILSKSDGPALFPSKECDSGVDCIIVIVMFLLSCLISLPFHTLHDCTSHVPLMLRSHPCWVLPQSLCLPCIVILSCSPFISDTRRVETSITVRHVVLEWK